MDDFGVVVYTRALAIMPLRHNSLKMNTNGMYLIHRQRECGLKSERQHAVDVFLTFNSCLDCV